MSRIAAIQMTSGPSVADNLGDAARLIEGAAREGARLVALPENFAVMPMKEADRLAIAERDGAGPLQDFLAGIARQHRIWLVGGTLPMLGFGGSRIRSACLLFNDRGERVARYDKMHLFDVRLANGERYEESSTFEPGAEPVVADTPVGKLGLAVCYDLRFPELFRRMLDLGAQLFVIPSAFTAHTGPAHWETLVRARAIENLAFVIAPDQSGRHANGRETHGDTMIVSPWGEVLDRRVHGPGIVIAECDLGHLERTRTALPSIQHRRLPA